MKIYVQLFNSSGCILDSFPAEIDEGPDFDIDLARAVHDFVGTLTLSVGDTIKIVEN
jgi:hypothetical protein